MTYLRQLGHDVEWVRDISELGVGSTDGAIAAYATDTDRLLLTQDDDFFTTMDIDRTAGVLFQPEQTLTAREVGDIVHEMAQYLDQSDVALEYVSTDWL